MRLLIAVLLTTGLMCFGCTDPEAPSNDKDPSMQVDAGTAANEDASVTTAPSKPTMVAPVAGGGPSSSTNFQGRFIITAPHPAGKTSSANHQATISVTGEQP